MSGIKHDEIERRLEEHDELLTQHTQQIFDLSKNQEVTNQRLQNIESNQQELKNVILTNNTQIYQLLCSMTTSMSQLVANKDDNATKMNIARQTNKASVFKQFLIVLGTVLTTLMVQGGQFFDKIKMFFN